MIAEEKFKNYGIVDTDITAVVMQVKDNNTYSLPIIARLPVQIKKNANKKTVAIQLPDNSIMVIDEVQILKTLNQC